jgi:hypothetical protein
VVAQRVGVSLGAVQKWRGQTLDRLGVEWRFSKPNTISVAKREAVALIDAASASSAARTWSSCQRYSTSRRHRPHPQQSAISSAATSTTGSSGLSAPEPLLTADRKSF